jgi:hypothetical protein
MSHLLIDVGRGDLPDFLPVLEFSSQRDVPTSEPRDSKWKITFRVGVVRPEFLASDLIIS